MKVKITQSYPTLCDPMDYTVYEILQARILEWVAFPFSRGSSQPGIEPRLNPGRLHWRWILYRLSHKGSPRILEWVTYSFSRGSSQPSRNLGLQHCRQILYRLSHKGSPRILEWVAYPFSSGSSRSKN